MHSQAWGIPVVGRVYPEYIDSAHLPTCPPLPCSLSLPPAAPVTFLNHKSDPCPARLKVLRGFLVPLIQTRKSTIFSSGSGSQMRSWSIPSGRQSKVRARARERQEAEISFVSGRGGRKAAQRRRDVGPWRVSWRSSRTGVKAKGGTVRGGRPGTRGQRQGRYCPREGKGGEGRAGIRTGSQRGW